MRLILLTTLVMIAFAANSVLNRMALVGDDTGPAAFALIRLAAGAVFLFGLASLRGGGIPWRAPLRLWGGATLALYVLGFSFAYVTLEAGAGALILVCRRFGGARTGSEGALDWRRGCICRVAGVAVAAGRHRA